ncbi:serine/threonine-protein kinase [Streptomyces lonarensis]|uniref:non-specific serine/threonine protein kinase n=1 Tax=Streptomyces lonarensis TaxID=700599 RepID=A0A7X6D2L8_9ACTN|nr:serine/threonine-protein kinase [Streptomyces lonarensis]NJQ07027.1 serine/threonine protein kinase [Streptomyces lonarensis]
MGHHNGERGDTGDPEDVTAADGATDERPARTADPAPPAGAAPRPGGDDAAEAPSADGANGTGDGASDGEGSAARAASDSPPTVSLGTAERESPATVTLGPDRSDLPSPRTVSLAPGVAAAADAAADARAADVPAPRDAAPERRPAADPDAERSAELGLAYGEELPDDPTGGDYDEDQAAFVPVPPVELLAHRYRLGALLGRGGMGTVWRATDEKLGRQVAVKELRLSSVIDDAERRRLITRTLREARAIATIRGRGVVTVFDVVDEGDRPWIVMELIEGRSLADVIREDGPLTPRRAAEVGLAVVDVLAAAHRAGIVHRDVKPSNVLVSDVDGRVVLTDFGIAKVEGDPSITSTGMLVGAPSYISPERACGEDFGPPADYWSLGALLYCALVGRPPYDRGGAISTLTAVMNDPVVVPGAAGPLAEVITGLLDKDPAERFDEPVARAMLRDVLDRSRRAAAGAGTLVLGADAARPAAREERSGAGAGPASAGPDSSADSGDLPATAAAGTAVDRSAMPADPL